MSFAMFTSGTWGSPKVSASSTPLPTLAVLMALHRLRRQLSADAQWMALREGGGGLLLLHDLGGRPRIAPRVVGRLPSSKSHDLTKFAPNDFNAAN